MHEVQLPRDKYPGRSDFRHLIAIRETIDTTWPIIKEKEKGNKYGGCSRLGERAKKHKYRGLLPKTQGQSEIRLVQAFTMAEDKRILVLFPTLQ